MDTDLAIGGMQPILESLSSLNEYSLADGIIQIAVARMVSAIKEISISKGFAPARFHTSSLWRCWPYARRIHCR
ncbi:MAG: hypothetical protein CM1200mP41_37600 [Gammaproteobacteria bacterium]|nr:MAG: hypothetical protein CM1200mP41_37600 [Gammaproteobacteria bacterium]